MSASLRSLFTGWLIASFLLVSVPAQAGMVGTEQMLAAESRAESLATVQAFVARAEVQSQLESWNVQPALAAECVAALSDAELQQLAMHIESQPAGAGAIGIIGVVFLILIILELVGVIDIFKKV
jgi:hypothetical protein